MSPERDLGTDVRSAGIGRAGGRESAPAFELLESKLRPPHGRSGAVPRAKLIGLVESARETPIVVLSAGPGWGKTTLLAQWASVSQRPFAWLSVDERDNDPIVLLTYVAVALDRVSPLDPECVRRARVTRRVGRGDGRPAPGRGAGDSTSSLSWSWTTCTCSMTRQAGTPSRRSRDTFRRARSWSSPRAAGRRCRWEPCGRRA